MAEFKVVGDKMIRVGNAWYSPRERELGETEGDELQVHDLEGGTLIGIRTENGELIFDVVGPRLEGIIYSPHSLHIRMG